MPISIIVGGQFGSEGKGKIALEVVRSDRNTVAAVRVGGTNSGHTAVDRNGVTRVLRQLPAAAIDRNVEIVLPAGSYIDIDIFRREVEELGLGPESVFISDKARIITREHRAWEADAALGAEIGSTQSGTGAAVLASIARGAHNFNLKSLLAANVEELRPFCRDTDELMAQYLRAGRRVVIEGTQGFGLSVLHGSAWPKATSRDTTAAGFLSEAGLSPLDVDDVTMVIRCHPIRVAGDSGPLHWETDWASIAREAGLPTDYKEFTTVTKKVRRVGKFESLVVRRAIMANRPSRIALNHLDYVDASVRSGATAPRAEEFVLKIEREIGAEIDWIGIGPDRTLRRPFKSRIQERRDALSAQRSETEQHLH